VRPTSISNVRMHCLANTEEDLTDYELRPVVAWMLIIHSDHD
jgi:hypothetical protein